MLKYILVCIMVMKGVLTCAQFSDNFIDGDHTSNPAWTSPNVTDWITNPVFQLQSNNAALNSSFHISTPSTLALMAQWDFYLQLAFNPSGANYVDVFLTSSSSDVTAAATTGYFVRIGNTDDEVSLWRKDGAVSVKVIDGINGILNTSNNILRIRVVRDGSNQWLLSRNIGGTGASFVNEGSISDATYSTSSYFGISIKQSTASFVKKHFFDDISVQPYIPDVIPPYIISATAASSNLLDLKFNEPVELTTTQQVANYEVSNGVSFPSAAVRDPADHSVVHLTFPVSFPANINLQIFVNGVRDIAGNTVTNGVANFSYFIPAPFAIVIDEIMADPTPVAGLPEAEWIELRNKRGIDIDLAGWRIGKPAAQSGPMPSYILKADSFVIVTIASAVTALSAFGPSISVTNFPSLSNMGDLIYLSSPEGIIVHSVNYTDEWYKNELKKAGGWSLEMIDSNNPCSGVTNWTSSIDPAGGSPGRKNTADAINPDTITPKLLRAFSPDSITIVLVFDEPLDSISASDPLLYNISDGIGVPVAATPLSLLFDHVQLRLTDPLLRNRVYTVTVSGANDCSGNTVSSLSRIARTGLYEQTDTLDIIINEILFNPRPNGSDYVELYNRSDKILNLKNAYIANRETNGSISSINQLANEDHLLFPHDFMVITRDVESVKRDYITLNPTAFIRPGTMPSYNDDAGDVLILNEQGSLIDEVNYDEKWHFKLITNNEGVALERIDYEARSNDSDSWHSAAASVYYGTPTYKNSQFRRDAHVKGELTVSPEIFSPDNDGIDDFATIHYLFPQPGYVANITIFDASGRQVRSLQRNALSGVNGSYKWDGLDEKYRALPVGLYIIYTEIFNMQGKSRKFKNTIVLARKIN